MDTSKHKAHLRTTARVGPAGTPARLHQRSALARRCLAGREAAGPGRRGPKRDTRKDHRHGKGLPLNRRGGELYVSRPSRRGGRASLICQERRTSFSVDEVRGFTQEEAERLRDLVFRQTGRGRG